MYLGTMKTLCFSLMIAATLPCAAQTPSKKHTPKTAPANPCLVTAPKQPQQTLKDDFAKSALRTLKMMEGETARVEQGPDGGTLVPRETNQALNDLDVEAQSKEDQAVVELLGRFFNAKLIGNTQIETMADLANIALIDAHNPRGVRVWDLMPKSPTVQKIRARENACSTEIDAMLRARTFHEVTACAVVALSGTTPEAFDVPVPAKLQ